MKWTADILPRFKSKSYGVESSSAEASISTSKEKINDGGYQNDIVALTLVHMQGPLLIYLLCIFITLGVFFGESTLSFYV